ncbi:MULTISPECIES: nuclear transport factor 2 family protein [Paenibacillus]|uniref:nuclear transport factor 2 family protein n=1 Tax=Paenibacillus TaxID=44249 RepID=UPI0022B9286F|nr:nuclear transport factor 2 family protein [Paenibacillus caseinilyticus]MCZ8520995.1 nuclear transport factor 2 family protein [Paenibacillus caseinilyticus]
MSGQGTKAIIERYIEAYNSFDVEGMLTLLHPDIVFRNFAGGEMNTQTRGIQEFRELAENASHMFASRQQTITDYRMMDEVVEVRIDYEGVLAVDLPNGLKAGETLELQGKSLFELSEGKIVRIEDYS